MSAEADVVDQRPVPDTEPPRRGGGGSWGRTLVAVAGGLAVGAVLAVLLFGGDDGPTTPVLDPGADPTAADAPAADPADVDVAPGDGADTPVVDVADATTPEQAVSSFLAAEAAGDFAASYAYLSADDTATWSSAELWRAAHAQFPPISGFEVTGTRQQGGDTIVEASLALESSLDPVIGLVPARATGEWAVTEADDGTFRVRYDDTVIAPAYPDPAGAVDVANAWAEGRVAGEDTSDLEGVGRLYGPGAVEDEIDAADGPVTTGAVQLLPPTGGSTDLISSFGSDVVGWARVVPLTTPVELAIVLAPVDDAWVVIGVLPREAVR